MYPRVNTVVLLAVQLVHVNVNVKVKQSKALDENSSYGESLAIWNHSVTCHPTQVNVPRLNPSQYAGTRFTYPGGMEG